MWQRRWKVECITYIKIERLVTDEKLNLPFENIPKVFSFVFNRAITHAILWNNVYTCLEQKRAWNWCQKLHFDHCAFGSLWLRKNRALCSAGNEIFRRILKQ